MAESSKTTGTISMKLLIDSKSKRVLFAEVGKECVDFLFQIMCLPLATVIKLLRKEGMVGCMANLYESIEKLNDTYVQSDRNKNILLNPTPSPAASSVPLILIKDSPEAEASGNKKKFYRCSNGCSYINITDDNRAICPQCRNISMNSPLTYIAPPPGPVANETSEEGGFVKGVVTYMVMDDLVVNPMSTISSITLLNQFQVKDLGALQEKVVNLNMTEGVKLLKASLKSRKVLTDVFLTNI